MSVTSLRYLFTPELLDGRLVSDISTTSQKEGLSKRDESGKPPRKTTPPKWQTIEFILYYAVVIIVIPSMFRAAYQISKGTPIGVSTYCKSSMFKG